ncbi:MAG: hypothetical protein GTN62_04345 [Gemmatimonadales bacterium]|nr:hypothetical protein [Gemmatimonadales bacterium]NIN10545.1 hypothetical protein [Gemmatimonadales bacterium]NIN49329.1 hypothetical protein [Gemmatimonadales bacterium]NIP06793.1 hypothetical protein [Gemmatimonadales bacterium]NIQ98910.1 hypothetical protein [Gemmatimonadales bacterium]
MVTCGVALLSACVITGIFVGELLGKLIGAQANIGEHALRRALTLSMEAVSPTGPAG